MMNYNLSFLPEKQKFLISVVAALITGTLLISTFIMLAADSPIFCTFAASTALSGTAAVNNHPVISTEAQLEIILHYATSRVVPQQKEDEIRVVLDVILSYSSCNFLIFGLGHDSLMWNSFNQQGTTLFLEEDPKWVQNIVNDAPSLQARAVRYRTKLVDAENLLQSYRWQPECMPARAFLRGNERCKLALDTLPEEVYEKDWDLIMIDGPRGYFGEAPGRMATIYSAAVMARKRRGSGVTHVFLHDADRRVEKAYAEEFLCRKYLVKAQGRLWHFEIPADATANMRNRVSDAVFC